MGQLFSGLLAVHSILSLRRLLAADVVDGDDDDGYDDDDGDLAQRYRPVVAVSVGWLLMYYWFLFRESQTAFKVAAALARRAKEAGKRSSAAIGMNAVKYGSAGGALMLNAKRTSGNMVEQSGPFLVALWLHGIFVSPRSAAKHGWVWLAARALYPFVFGKVPWLFASTFPGYAVVLSLVYPLAKKSW